MAKLQSFVYVALLCFATSFSFYIGPIAPQYYTLPEVVRSSIPHAVARLEQADPRLSQLLMAKKQAIRITNDINSEIQAILRDNVYRRTFDGGVETDSNGEPFLNLRPTNRLSAIIGAQGGTWFPGPSGVGMTGSRMLGGQADYISRLSQVTGFRRTQEQLGLPVQTGTVGPSSALLQRALAFRNMNSQIASPPQSQVAPLRQMPIGQQPIEQANQISARTFTPATAQSTTDPSDEIEKLGNPKEFDEKCAVLKLTFEKSNGAMVFDDSPQRNDAKLKGDVHVSKDETDLGQSVVFGNNGKIVLQNGFKGKPKKSVAISMWVKLNYVKGKVPLITATDENNFVRYDLLLHNGKGEWIHRGDSGRELFHVQSSSSDVTAGEWHNIVGSYDSRSRTASLWVDGKEVSKQDGVSGMLSQKWNKLIIFGAKSRGDMDNVFMFRCPLDRTKIVALYVSDASHKDVKKD